MTPLEFPFGEMALMQLWVLQSYGGHEGKLTMACQRTLGKLVHHAVVRLRLAA